MIFNEMNTNTTVSYETVQESPYELGIGGALMHVYENECNYNALMKAATLSEMKYYNETGKSLFVQEAGAFSSFISKAKDFFKKVIEKIKSICKKFVAKIRQYTASDKDFVKKYQNEIIMKQSKLKDFEFDGYKFTGIDTAITTKDINTLTGNIDGSSNSDDINDKIEANRPTIIGKSGSMTESEFRDALNELFKGDKESINNIDLSEQLRYISDTKKAIDDAERAEKNITDSINKSIKEMENLSKALVTARVEKDTPRAGKVLKSEDRAAYNVGDANATQMENGANKLNNMIKLYRAYCNDLTITYGAKVKALNDRNRQARAICIKALSYKHEAAMVESYNDDIFAGVSII